MATLSQAGFNKLKQEEGYKLKAYRLSGEGHCTCCLGHFGADVQCGRTYTDAECQAFFAKDSARFCNDVNKIFNPATMTQNMFDAMFSFAYNHGNISNTKLGKTIKANPKNFSEIQRVWEASYCSGRYANVLSKRRKREAALYCGSAYSSSPLNTSGESYGSGEENENNTSAWEYEAPTYSDVSSAISDVDYGSLNQSLAYATNKMDETYDAFKLSYSSSDSSVNSSNQEMKVSKHEGETEDHSLIVDEDIKPSIAQDEHSNIIKEDTDKSEGYNDPIEKRNVPDVPGVAVSSGFAI